MSVLKESKSFGQTLQIALLFFKKKNDKNFDHKVKIMFLLLIDDFALNFVFFSFLFIILTTRTDFSYSIRRIPYIREYNANEMPFLWPFYED